MDSGSWRFSPALAVACLALFVALGGTVLAAAKIDGRTIRVKSLPGNRLALGSLPGNRLKPGAIQGNRLAPGSVTGTEIDPSTLGTVPTATHADTAESARDAQTALNAVNAIDATRVNGHSAGCQTGTRYFAGACWQLGSSAAAVSAPTAALACATLGGQLPEALALAAFSQQAGVVLAAGDEWTDDLASYSGSDAYSVALVSAGGKVQAAVSTTAHKYRCVLPLVA
jgi:hypothetical protein